MLILWESFSVYLKIVRVLIRDLKNVPCYLTQHFAEHWSYIHSSGNKNFFIIEFQSPKEIQSWYRPTSLALRWDSTFPGKFSDGQQITHRPSDKAQMRFLSASAMFSEITQAFSVGLILLLLSPTIRSYTHSLFHTLVLLII